PADTEIPLFKLPETLLNLPVQVFLLSVHRCISLQSPAFCLFSPISLPVPFHYEGNFSALQSIIHMLSAAGIQWHYQIE
ncbi:MAG: hypothetical protein PUC99_00430, partial [Eubacteriales bacterium]|nr:hypothetical protein [Eubacteriales bacterium]